jgi:phosphatidylserine/phosphatidylglycerophosphate/cardiolipin synthase-like enzyme
VYVHATVGIIDDRCLMLGSANLNAHSFSNDAEVDVVTCEPGHAICDCDCRPPISNATLMRSPTNRARGESLTHKLVELRASSRRFEQLLGPSQALLVAGEPLAHRTRGEAVIHAVPSIGAG